MNLEHNIDPEIVLSDWRTRILNGFLAMVAIAAAVMTGMSILDATSHPDQWPSAILFLTMELALAVLAIFRKIDHRIRAWGVLLVPYIVGVTALASFGLGSSGRIYLLAVPIGALLLIGVRSGIFMSALSILTMAAFAILAERGMLLNWLVTDRNSLLAGDWLAESVDTWMLIMVVMALLVMFYRFQERLIANERNTHTELLRTQALLEGQNAILEQKVRERTDELQAHFNELQIINSIQQGLAATVEFQASVDLVGDKLRILFNTPDLGIKWFDEKNSLVHYVYLFEHGKRFTIEAQPLLPETAFARMIKDHQKVVWNTEREGDAVSPVIPGTDSSQSGIVIPIISSDRVLGSIQLENYEREYAYGESELRLLTTIAGSLGAALENARLFDETQRLFQAEQQRVAELQIINSIQQGLAAELDFQAILDIAGDKLRKIFGADTFGIVLYDPKTHQTTFPYVVNRGERVSLPSTPLGGISGHVLKSGKTMVFNRNFEFESENYDSEMLVDDVAPKSGVYVPIIAGTETIGVVTAQNYEEEDAYPESIVRLLEIVTAHMGTALENARLFDETQRLLKETEQRNSELAIINSVQAGLASKLEMQAIYELIGEKVREVFHVQVVDIVIYDPTANLICMPYSYENGDRSVISPREPYGFRLKVINSGVPLLINEDFAALASQYNNPLLTGDWPKSALFVPLLVDDKVKAIISIQDLERENAFSPSGLRLLQTLANSMSVALENARLFDETQRLLKETEQRAAELATINTVNAALTSELDVSVLINLVGEQTRVTFNADIAYVALLDNDRGIINFPYTYGEELTPIQYGEGLTSKILQTKEPLLINQELNRQTQELGATIVGKQSLSYLGVPIVVSGQAVGVLSVQSSTQEGIFDPDDARLLGTIASNVGTALHNAQLFSEVQNQRKFSEALIDFLPDATLVIDSQGQVIAWNRAIEEMTGVKAEDMLGKNEYQYALPFYGERRPILIDLVLMPRAEFESKYAHIQRAGETLIGETYTPSLRGGRYLYATASAFQDARGNTVGAIETIRDITERKQSEVELQQAKDAADAANATKSAFLANMSHELRTPLNAIIGFTRIVRRKADGLIPEKQTDNLDKVLTSAEHLLNLINTVLDIAKIEAGRMDVLAANFRINALIDLCANTAQPLLRPHVTLEKQIDESLSVIYSDQDKIRQIILNLLSNAAKFTHEGRIILTANRDGKYLHVSVADSGIGIGDEALPHIFKEFQQADPSTTRQYGGTGLGLSISRNLAHLLGGDLTVESELGKGSTFTLVIPLQYGSSPASTPDREPGPVPESAPCPATDATKKRILVIDDDPDAVYLLQENLNQNEFIISGARSGREGLRIARDQQPQAILLDILMPETDGWQILNDLKEDAVTANIPVILLTIVDKKALGFRLGAAAYLLKPLDPLAVRDALNRVIIKSDRGQKHILVVDDDPNIADMLRQFLPESEFRLESALDGVAGLEAIGAHRPDILLLDIIMPRLDGFGVIEKLRSNPQTRDLPIIVISAKDLTADESALLKETVAFVMRKQGFQGEQLLEEINSALTE